MIASFHRKDNMSYGHTTLHCTMHSVDYLSTLSYYACLHYGGIKNHLPKAMPASTHIVLVNFL